ncbi:MAG: ankyrin repeat domain-containing protein [bacterium]
MKYKYIFSAIGVLSIFIILIGCSKPPTAEQQNARKELEKKGIAYTTEAFFEEINKGNIENLNLFFNAGMSPNAENKGMPALHAAVLIGRDEPVKLFLDKGAKVDERVNGGMTALLFAAKLGFRANQINMLIAKGANVNAKTNSGTAVLFAVINKDVESIKVLLANGADVNAKSNDGKTPLALAKETGSAEIVKLLQQAGAK